MLSAWKKEQIDMVVNQTFKGIKNTNKVLKKELTNQFKEKYESTILEIINRLPECSSAIPAVLLKASYTHKLEKVYQFCDAIKKQQFHGMNDPAFHLWKFISGSAKMPTQKNYQKACYAVKNYMENKEITSLRADEHDILRWNGKRFLNKFNKPTDFFIPN